jgi:hypothetical protein
LEPRAADGDGIAVVNIFKAKEFSIMIKCPFFVDTNVVPVVVDESNCRYYFFFVG